MYFCEPCYYARKLGREKHKDACCKVHVQVIFFICIKNNTGNSHRTFFQCCYKAMNNKTEGTINVP